METMHPEVEFVEAPVEGSSDRCANCGTARRGAYCHHCGQRQASRVVPLRRLLTEAVATYFNLDNRLLRTLKMLLLRPGRLTEVYVQGQRAQYVSPIRLYLFFSVIYFFLAVVTEATTFLIIEFDFEGETEAFAQLFPKMMFVIVPGFALLLKGLYWRQRRLYVEHLIFALHVHVCWYVLFMFDVLLRPVVDPALEAGQFTVLAVLALIVFIPTQLAIPVYLFMAMRYVYGQSRLVTFLKFFALNLGYMLLLLSAVLAYILLPGGPELWWFS